MRRPPRISIVVIVALLVAIVGAWTAPGEMAAAAPTIAQTHQAIGEALQDREGHAHHASHGTPTETPASVAPDGEQSVTASAGTDGVCGSDPHYMGDTCCSFACHIVVDLRVHEGTLRLADHATGGGRISHAVLLGHVPGLERPPRAI